MSRLFEFSRSISKQFKIKSNWIILLDHILRSSGMHRWSGMHRLQMIGNASLTDDVKLWRVWSLNFYLLRAICSLPTQNKNGFLLDEKKGQWTSSIKNRQKESSKKPPEKLMVNHSFSFHHHTTSLWNPWPDGFDKLKEEADMPIKMPSSHEIFFLICFSLNWK